MSIPVTCPSGHLLKVADNMAGRAGRCPLCREIVNVPELRRAGEGEKSSLGSRSRLGSGPVNPAAAVAKSPPTDKPAAVAPDPAAADTVLMPLNLGETPVSDDPALAAQQAAAEPDSPIAAEPDLMAQTLPLPTAELMPRRSAGAADPAHDIGFDTAGHKAKIIGSWKVLGDVEPPYIPETAPGRSMASAAGAFEAAAATSAASGTSAVARSTTAPTKTSPPPPLLPTTSSKVTSPKDAQSQREPNGPASAKTSWFRNPIATGSARSLRTTVYRIAAGLVFVSLVSMWPALRYWDLGVAPGWAQGVLLIALLQLAYAAWLVSIPDWASLWASMFVLAIVATLYGTTAAMTLATPMEHEPPLGLQSVRHAAPYWCFCMMLLTISAAYLCGHAAQRIRRAAKRT
jgi:hypothetical protein